VRILANENVALAAVQALRARGHDVAWVREDAPGTPDEAVLDRAQAEQRVLLTFDKDFGELAFRRGLPAACGVILLRIATPSPDHMAATLAKALDVRADWEGHFSVIEDDRIRMTPLPDKQP
jgi:predicted nuclease of predicted toxin-antitoxin system